VLFKDEHGTESEAQIEAFEDTWRWNLEAEHNYTELLTEAVSAGFYHSPGWNQDYPCIQILTIEDLFHNAEVKMPPQFGTFKQAPKVQQGYFP